jgi:hypothetical protein
MIHLGLSIKKLLTLCRVARLGFAFGIEVEIQPNRLLTKALVYMNPLTWLLNKLALIIKEEAQ